MKRKSLKLLLLSLITAMLFCVGCSSGKSTPTSSEPPKPTDFTVATISESLMVGRELTLPKVEAVQGYEVKVSVIGYNADNTITDEPITRKAATATNSFRAKISCTKYVITYYMALDGGEKIEKTFTVTVTADTQNPYIQLPADFDLTEGLVTDELTGYNLEGFVGLDAPDALDITDKLSVTIYSGDVVKDHYTYDGKTHTLFRGTYRVVLNLKDLSDNAAESVEFPLVVNKSDVSGQNLISSFEGTCSGSGMKNFVAGNSGGYKKLQFADEKVSITATAADTYGQLRINIAGLQGPSVDWTAGLCLVMYEQNMKLAFGSGEFVEYTTNPLYGAVDQVTFSYQVTPMTISGEEYLRVRVWNGTEEIEASPLANPNANVVFLDQYGYEGIAIKMSAFNGTDMSRTDLWIANILSVEWNLRTDVTIYDVRVTNNTEEKLVIA